MSESELMKQIQIEASRIGARLLRNNVGRLQDHSGRYVQFGLAVGSSDLIGWMPCEISGQTIARFVAIEVKTEKGKATKEQLAFIEAVKQAGGIAFVARSVDEAIRGLRAGTS